MVSTSKTYQFPEVFRLDLDLDPNKRVKRSRLIHGFSYRPVERIIATGHKSVHETIYIVERICGLCSHAHATAFCQAAETCFGLDPPPAARQVRSLVAEFERLADHLLHLGEVAHILDEKTLFRAVWDLRKKVACTAEKLTEKRVHFGINCIGGVNSAPAVEEREETLSDLPNLRADTLRLNEIFADKCEFKLAGRGVFKGKAGMLEGTGPNLRAFGDARDIRSTKPYAA